MYKLKVTPETWIISDTHFGHDNIIKHCKRPKNHDALMLRNWIKMVKKNDVILHLGDLMVWYDFNRVTRWAQVVKHLPGRKYMILGNHDDDIPFWTTKSDWKKKTNFTLVEPFLQNQTYFSHYKNDLGLGLLNIHGHSHQHAPFGVYHSPGYTYYNASIEGQNYKPKRLGDILKEVQNA